MAAPQQAENSESVERQENTAVRLCA